MQLFSAPATSTRIRQLAFLVFLISGSACQPKDVSPGLWLSGDVVENTVDDWTFTDDIEEIFIQTQTWYLLPHSTTIWCVELNGELYIGSYAEESAEEKKVWENNVVRNSAARLGIDGRLYEVSVVPVTNADTTSALDTRYAEKYDMAEVFGEHVPEWWYYQVSQRN